MVDISENTRSDEPEFPPVACVHITSLTALLTLHFSGVLLSALHRRRIKYWKRPEYEKYKVGARVINRCVSGYNAGIQRRSRTPSLVYATTQVTQFPRLFLSRANLCDCTYTTT